MFDTSNPPKRIATIRKTNYNAGTNRSISGVARSFPRGGITARAIKRVLVYCSHLATFDLFTKTKV